MTKKTQHVVPNTSGGWSVKKGGSSKATKVFDNQTEAITFARTLAKNSQSELYIHKKDGTISSKDSFGKDPAPPKDKK